MSVLKFTVQDRYLDNVLNNGAVKYYHKISTDKEIAERFGLIYFPR